MELTSKQQAVELIKKSNNILITTNEDNKGDGISSGLALAQILEKSGKEVTFIVCGDLHKKFDFLPGYKKIEQDFSGSRDFIISLSLEKGGVSKVSYDYNAEQNKLHFFVSPKNNSFKSEDVVCNYGNFKFDLVVVLDCADLESLGSIYDKNADFFYNQPVINIDHHSGNDYFGAANLVDLTASSTGEILVSIIESLGANLIDADIATNLLAGVISDTNSFQNSNTTPKSLTVTAQLIAAGAEHDLVIRNLFKTKSFDMLKIWGKILSSVKIDNENRILWSTVKEEDIGNTADERGIVTGVLDELLSTAPEVKVYLLFLEKNNALKVFVKTSRDIEAREISYLFGGFGKYQEGEFEVEGSDIGALYDDVLGKVKQYLANANSKE